MGGAAFRSPGSSVRNRAGQIRRGEPLRELPRGRSSPGREFAAMGGGRACSLVQRRAAGGGRRTASDRRRLGRRGGGIESGRFWRRQWRSKEVGVRMDAAGWTRNLPSDGGKVRLAVADC